VEKKQVKSVMIMKYQGKDDKYYFIVKDKFDIADSVERLDAINKLRDEMLASGKMKKHLWTKETVLF
jgi:hypothetical protein